MASDIVITGAVAFGGKLAHDVLGPTCKYLGSEMKGGAEAGAQNVKRVFEKAYRFITLKRDQGGAVPPRVLKSVLDQGYFCEDEVQASYLGGVLASSKGGNSRDDRAISYLSIIDSLSTYQLRTHFILYGSLLKTDQTTLGRAYLHLLRANVTVSITETDYVNAMEFTETEPASNIAHHSFTGLQTKGLIEKGDLVVAPTSGGYDPFRYFYPTHLGMELFLWGVGCGELSTADFGPDLLDRIKIPIKLPRSHVVIDRVTYG